MLVVLALACCVPMTHAGPISGYSRGTPSGGRGQEYSGAAGYKTDTFVGTKDFQGDFSDNTGSNHYPVITGGTGHSSTTGSSYVTDSGYSDPDIINGQSGAYGSQTNTGSSSSSYADVQAASSELGGSNYSPSIGTSGGLVGYSSGGASGNIGGNHAGYKDYADGTMGGGAGGKFSLGLPSSKERGEYSSSRPASSYGSYALGGPKSSAYASLSNHRGNQAHGIKSYSPSQGFTIGGHRGISSLLPSSSSSYSSEPSHAVVTSGSSNYASGPSLKSYLANIHASGNFLQHGGGSLHRTTPSHHLFASASNLSPSYNTRGPPSGGFFTSGNPYHRGNANPGGKIIVVKESGNNLHNPGHVYPNEHHGYTGGMFGPSNSLYKIRNVSSQTSHGSSNYPSVYSTSGNYNGASSPSSSSALHSSHNNGGSFFSFL